jgi:hypothetical protein
MKVVISILILLCSILQASVVFLTYIFNYNDIWRTLEGKPFVSWCFFGVLLGILHFVFLTIKWLNLFAIDQDIINKEAYISLLISFLCLLFLWGNGWRW